MNSDPSAGKFEPPRIAIPMPTSTNDDYNRRAWPLYAQAVVRAGGLPVEAPLGESQSSLARIASSCSGILLPGSPADVDPEKYGEQRIPECGSKDPAREAADELLLQDAFNLHKPIFGICYGLQSLNVWRNGTLIQHLGDQAVDSVNHAAGREVSQAHTVAVAPGSCLAQILTDAADLEHTADFLRLWVNSSHHQSVRQQGDQLTVVARSPVDGVIEALEGQNPDHFVIGVQWHPERSYDASAASRALFSALILKAASWRPRAIQESVAG
jgi:putative glutamine amidotransferase